MIDKIIFGIIVYFACVFLAWLNIDKIETFIFLTIILSLIIVYSIIFYILK